ncbi:MAG: DNA recombination protein RmuC [Candidatus Izimaplasma sp.]|nr:DNA recombination protein RmuC [Candidatus Izimaplasma bacterium]
MILSEILSLIAGVLSFAGVVILIVLLYRSKNSNQIDVLDNSLKENVNVLEKNLAHEINDAMLKFNNLINDKLQVTSEKSKDNITDFRLNVNKQLGEFQEKISEKFSNEFKSLSNTVDTRMNSINEKVEERLSKGFENTNETFTKIVERVSKIGEAQKEIESLSKEMVSLQNILSNNQARGAFGEFQLEQLLSSLFGDAQYKQLYQTQYTIKQKNANTVRVDAIVDLPGSNGKIAIDSKFPYASYSKLFSQKQPNEEERKKLLSEFSREVKKHITDISKKYIVPNVTADYALMFVPSDGILTLLHSELTNVVQYAREKRITIVSPTTLVPLLTSYRSMYADYTHSKNAEIIKQQLKKLSKDFKNFGSEWQKLSNAINSLKQRSDQVDFRVDKITTNFDQINTANPIKDDDTD